MPCFKSGKCASQTEIRCGLDGEKTEVYCFTKCVISDHQFYKVPDSQATTKVMTCF